MKFKTMLAAQAANRPFGAELTILRTGRRQSHNRDGGKHGFEFHG